MIHKGTVLKLEHDFAVVMTDDARYVKILKKTGITAGKHILFLDEDIYREKNTDILKHYKYAAVFILFLFSTFLFLNFNNIYMSKEVAAVINIDINPSIELGINSEEKVIKVTPLNEEASEILNINLTKKKVEKVIETLLLNAEAHKYFEHQYNMVLLSLTVLNKDSKIDIESIKTDIEQILNKNALLKEIEITYMDVESTALEKARANEMSAGRYQMYEEIKEYSGEITIEAAKTMKLQKLITKHRYRGAYQYESIIKSYDESTNINKPYTDSAEQTQQQTKIRNRKGMGESSGNGNEKNVQNMQNKRNENQAQSKEHKHENEELQIIEQEETTPLDNNQQDKQKNSEVSEDAAIDRTQEHGFKEGKSEESNFSENQGENKEEVQQKPEPSEKSPKQSEDQDNLTKKKSQ